MGGFGAARAGEPVRGVAEGGFIGFAGLGGEYLHVRPSTSKWEMRSEFRDGDRGKGVMGWGTYISMSL